MTAVLIIATLGVMVLGLFVMKRIDAFIDGGGIIDSPQGRLNVGFLVFGSATDAALIREAGFRCVETDAARIPDNVYFSALFALAESAEANLQMCHAAKNIDPGIFIIARCHSPALCGVYRDAGTEHILSEREPIGGIPAELREMQYEK